MEVSQRVKPVPTIEADRGIQTGSTGPYDQGTTPLPRSNPSDFTSFNESDASKIIGGLDSLGTAAENQQKKEEAIWVAQQVSQGRLDMGQKLNDIHNAAEDGTGYDPKQFMDEYNTYVNGQLKNAPSGRARDALIEHYLQFEPSVEESVLHANSKAAANANGNAAINILTNALGSNSADTSGVVNSQTVTQSVDLAKGTAAATEGSLPAPQAATVNVLQSQSGVTGAQEAAASDPVRFNKDLNAGKYDGVLSPEQAQALNAQVIAQLATDKGAAHSVFQQKASDILARAENEGKGAAPQEILDLFKPLKAKAGVYVAPFLEKYNESLTLGIAKNAMVNMTPQEANDYLQRFNPAAGASAKVASPEGLITPGNIDLTNRPKVQNEDGSYSTVRTITAEINGQTVLLPTVIGGKVVSVPDAIQHYKDTGEHMGIFDSEASADKYDEALHQANGWNGPKNTWAQNQQGYAEKLQTYDKMLRFYEHNEKTKQDDPFAYSLQNPDIQAQQKTVAQLQQNAAADPSQRPALAQAQEDLITKSLAFQAQVGVQKPSIISQNDLYHYADTIKDKFNDPNAVAQVFQGINAQYGRYAYKVAEEMSQLPKEHQLPDEWNVVLANPDKGPLTRDLISAQAMPKDLFEKVTHTADYKQAEPSYTADPQVTLFKRAMYATGGGQDLQTYVNGIVDGGKRLGIYNISRGNAIDSADSAKKMSQAAAQLFGDFQQGGTDNRPYLIPSKDSGNAPFSDSDRAAIAPALQNELQTLTGNSRLPNGIMIGYNGQKPEDMHMVLDNMKQNAYWASTPDTKGVQLMTIKTTPEGYPYPIPVLDVANKPIMRDFRDVVNSLHPTPVLKNELSYRIGAQQPTRPTFKTAPGLRAPYEDPAPATATTGIQRPEDMEQ